MKELDEAFDLIIELNLEYSRFKDIGIKNEELRALIVGFYQKQLKEIANMVKETKVK